MRSWLLLAILAVLASSTSASAQDFVGARAMGLGEAYRAIATGNDDGLTGRVLLLDATGKVVFFHDRGFSVGSLQRLQQALAALPTR